MKKAVNLRINLLNPPIGVDFGLQQGSGNNYKIVQKQRSTTNDLIFEFSILIKEDTEKKDPPNFRVSLFKAQLINSFTLESELMQVNSILLGQGGSKYL